MSVFKSLHNILSKNKRSKHKFSNKNFCKESNNVNNVHGGLKAETHSVNSPFNIHIDVKNQYVIFRFLTSIPFVGSEQGLL